MDRPLPVIDDSNRHYWEGAGSTDWSSSAAPTAARGCIHHEAYALLVVVSGCCPRS